MINDRYNSRISCHMERFYKMISKKYRYTTITNDEYSARSLSPVIKRIGQVIA